MATSATSANAILLIALPCLTLECKGASVAFEMPGWYCPECGARARKRMCDERKAIEFVAFKDVLRST